MGDTAAARPANGRPTTLATYNETHQYYINEYKMMYKPRKRAIHKSN